MFQNITSLYIIISLTCFSLWFILFLRDDTTPKNDLLSWIILLFAPWIWFIVLPLSIRELVKKFITSNKKFSNYEDISSGLEVRV